MICFVCHLVSRIYLLSLPVSRTPTALFFKKNLITSMGAMDTHPHSPKMQSSENHNFHYRFSLRGAKWIETLYLFGGYSFRALSLKCIKISMTFAFSFCIIIFWWFDKIFGWMCKNHSVEKNAILIVWPTFQHIEACARGARIFKTMVQFCASFPSIFHSFSRSPPLACSLIFGLLKNRKLTCCSLATKK